MGLLFYFSDRSQGIWIERRQAIICLAARYQIYHMEIRVRVGMHANALWLGFIVDCFCIDKHFVNELRISGASHCSLFVLCVYRLVVELG